MPPVPLITAENLRVSYGSTVALDGVTLPVKEGTIFALIGPNGAGKTTLVRCLTGTKTPDQGRAQLLGSRPEETDPGALGVLPQNFSPPERLSAWELVDYYGGLYAEARPAERVLRTVGLAEIGPTRYANLSGGEQRRVDVATTLVNDPRVLFLDEPTTGIDPQGRRNLWALIEGLADAGTTIFLTTHYMEEAEELAEQVGLLAEGHLVETGPPDALVDRYGGPNRLIVETRAETDWTDAFPYPVEADSSEAIITGITAEEIGAVVGALDEREIPYQSLRWKRPDLEDVFLRLAGDRPVPSPAA